MRKLISLLAFWSLVALFGSAIAQPKVDHSKKVKVDAVQFGTMIDITVLPLGDYKWNKKYPAKLSFSLCNDTECVIITKEIKIKNE